MCAATAHHQIDFRRTKSLRQLHINLRPGLVETKRLPTRFAGEMRVMTMRGCLRRRWRRIGHEAPHPVIACDAMRDTLIHQPLQYAINGHTINRMVIGQHTGDIEVGTRAFAREQAGQHRNARLRKPFTGRADGGFCGGNVS